MAGIIDNELYSLYYIENNRSQIMSDHLGSASFLTDNNGNETQELVYLPYGEDWVDIKYNTQQFETPYKFNGKEKDLESGYSYYGARYYYDWLSIWLSVDPLSDKYPSTSSYAYCRNNPIMLIDPDGMDDDGWEVNHQNKTVKKVSDEGGENKQIIRSNNGFVLTKDQSTKDFVSECYKDGYTVDKNSSSALEYTNLGLSLTGGIISRVSHALKTAENSYKGMQAQSDALGFGLDYSKELGKVGKIGSSVKGIGYGAGALGVGISALQLYNSKTVGQKIENGFDMLMGVAGFAGPVGAGISLYWGTIGKPLTRMHAKTITEQMKMGINPGLPAYQPFK